MSTRPSNRSGAARIAVCTTMPPIEWPRATQRSQPRASSKPSRSAAKASKRVRRLVVGLAARAVAALVGGDRVPAELGQRVELVGEVLLGAGEAVDEEQRPPAGAGLGDGER